MRLTGDDPPLDLQLLRRRWTTAEVRALRALIRNEATHRDISRRLDLPIESVPALLAMRLHMVQPDKVHGGLAQSRGRCPRCELLVAIPCVACCNDLQQARMPRPVADDEPPVWREILETPIAELDFGIRQAAKLVNKLESQGVLFVNDLLHLTPRQLARIGDLGAKSEAAVYRGIDRLFARHGIRRLPREGHPV